VGLNHHPAAPAGTQGCFWRKYATSCVPHNSYEFSSVYINMYTYIYIDAGGLVRHTWRCQCFTAEGVMSHTDVSQSLFAPKTWRCWYTQMNSCVWAPNVCVSDNVSHNLCVSAWLPCINQHNIATKHAVTQKEADKGFLILARQAWWNVTDVSFRTELWENRTHTQKRIICISPHKAKIR